MQLVSALILSRLDYCNNVLAGLPKSTLAILQRVQNAAARLILELRPRTISVTHYVSCTGCQSTVESNSMDLIEPIPDNNTRSLQDAILSNCTCSTGCFHTDYLSIWSSTNGPLPDTLPSKQPFWDRPGLLADRAMVEANLNTTFQRACFLAASSPQTADWLFALPIASCGFQLDDEANRIAVGIRLGLAICVPHQCHCGEQVDAFGIHSFVCKRAPGRISRHQALNEVIARAFQSAGIPSTKEPNGLSRL